MIVTVTPNPSVDRALVVDRLVRGEVLRTSGHQRDPGGKGINVSRALHANGHATTAVVPIGGSEGDLLLRLLDGTGLTVVTVPIAGSVRSNITVAEPDGTVTKLNEPGPELSPEELQRLVDTSITAAADAEWLVVSGSLPPDAPTSLLTELIQRGHAAGTRAAIDTSGAALTTALAAAPDLVKPNAEELAECTGLVLHTLGDVIDAALALRGMGAGAVLASLGPDGALYLDDDIQAHAELAVTHPKSTVGAGDATLAGFLTASDRPLAGLRAAVAFGAAAVQLPGSRLPGPADLHLDAVVVHEQPDRARLLSGAPQPAVSHA
jgi:1-phosphofructokinase